MNCDNNNLQTTQSIADYLAQLLKDRKQLAAFPTVFNHVERLLDEGKLFYFNSLMFFPLHAQILLDHCIRTKKDLRNILKGS